MLSKAPDPPEKLAIENSIQRGTVMVDRNRAILGRFGGLCIFTIIFLVFAKAAKPLVDMGSWHCPVRLVEGR